MAPKAQREKFGNARLPPFPFWPLASVSSFLSRLTFTATLGVRKLQTAHAPPLWRAGNPSSSLIAPM